MFRPGGGNLHKRRKTNRVLQEAELSWHFTGEPYFWVIFQLGTADLCEVFVFSIESFLC
jgi:hypothetical protein